MQNMFSGKKKWLWVALVLAGIGGWYWWSHRTPEALFVTETIGRSDISETVSVVGTLRPTTYADISFLSLGTVDQVFFEEGESVRQGDVIATLDTAVLQSELKRTQVALSIAEENEKLAHRSWDDLKPEERAVKKLTTKQARESVRTVAAQIDQSRVIAPMDGVLSKLDVRVGETMLAGKLIGRISGPGASIIEADVPEADIASVAVGKRAYVAFDALSADDTFEATVTSIDKAANVIQDVIYYTIMLSLDNQDSRLKEGMSADIDIRISERSQVLSIPYRALIRDGERSFVEIALSDTESERRQVSIGVEGDDGTIEVLSGVAEGDRVVVGKNK